MNTYIHMNTRSLHIHMHICHKYKTTIHTHRWGSTIRHDSMALTSASARYASPKMPTTSTPPLCSGGCAKKSRPRACPPHFRRTDRENVVLVTVL